MATSDAVPTIRTCLDRTYKIAVVDDDKADFTLISRLLEYSGRGEFRLTHITNYDDAVSRLESETFDVALVDQFLDGKLGIDLIRRLGGRIAPCALIMLTGGISDELDLAALEAGVADYIDKNDLSAQMLARSVIYAHARFDIERQFRKSQAQLRQARDEAAADNIAKTEFLSRMSHQLRSPLNSIVGFSEIIANRSLGEKEWEKYIEFAQDIQDSGTILLDMINDVLDMTKLDAGELALEIETLDLSPVIVEVTGNFKEACNEKDLVIIHEQSDKTIEALVDPRAVRKILKILLSNAVKFTPTMGEIRVSSRVSRESAIIVVADTGIGIAEADIPRVLMPFEQIEQTDSQPQRGTGFGLAVAKSLVEMQGGSIRVESTEGSGTRVFVAFPNARADVETAA